MVRRPVLSLAAIPAAAVILAGCGGNVSDTPSGSVSETPAPTQDIDPRTGLPRSFPGDFPIIRGASVTRASEYPDRYVIEWRAEDSLDDAISFYEASLARTPWQIDNTRTESNATIFDLSGGSSSAYSGSLAVARLDGGARILLNLIRG